MALATQCPHCHTTFRVAHDQLKLRAGLVRCGACKQIFNGIENLLRPDEDESPVSTTVPVPGFAPPPAVPKPAPEMPASSEGPDGGSTELPRTNASDLPLPPETQGEGTQDSVVPADDTTANPDARNNPLLRMTLMDFTHDHAQPGQGEASAKNEAAGEGAPDEVEQAIDDLQSKPWRDKEEAESSETDALDAADTAEYEEPAFVRQGRRRQRIGRVLRVVMLVGSVLLLLGLIGQGAYVFRDQIAVRFPGTRPLLNEACAYIGCQVGLPSQIDYVSIESSELQVLSPDSNVFTLSALLRNRGATDEAWPYLELTLNDANDKPIVRRVFTPRDYLPTPQDAQKGFGQKSEQSIKLFFEVSQLKPSGYRLYLFYP